MRDRFLRACRREEVDRTPVWFMRQAGRYLEEYRALRAKHGFLEICGTPELAVQATLQPLRHFEADAAILFSDILFPLLPLGVGLEFSEGEGPRILEPLRSEADILALRKMEPREELRPALEAIVLIKKEIGELPLIGFVGAPFTLASYLIEGGSSRSFVRTKKLMLAEPRLWHLLMEKLADLVSAYALAQVEAGADAVQLFDSWAGCLCDDDYRSFVLPHSKRVFEALRGSGVPTIHFGVDTACLLEAMGEAGSDVVGLDWRCDLAGAWKRVGPERAIQGNLDPAALFAPREELEKRVKAVLAAAGGRSGHIFNLGHGVLPETPVESLEAVVDMVHEFSERRRA